MKVKLLIKPILVITVAALLPLNNSISAQEITAKDVNDLMVSLSNWGRWGNDDQMGTLNLITPESRVAAAKLVSSGISVSMARQALRAQSRSLLQGRRSPSMTSDVKRFPKAPGYRAIRSDSPS